MSSASNKHSSFGSDNMLDRLLERISPERRYRRAYLDYLIYQHRNFDVKGLTTQGVFTLELEKVFVELSLGPESRPQSTATLIRPLRDAARKGRHTLHSYLASSRMASCHFVVLGPPGGGKTTLLKHLTLSLAAHTLDHSVENLANRLPILLFLRDHAQAIGENPNLTLVEAVQERLSRWEVETPPDWLASQLAQGSCIVMLDGVDEVGDEALRQKVIAWAQRQINQYGHNNRFVVTSRPFGYRSNPLENVVVLDVRPFSLKQVERFLHNWYLANEIMSTQRDDPGVRMEARSGAEDLLRRLRLAPALLEMAVNPLLLTMIATVHRYRSSLPGRRVELYAEICEVFLGKRHQARGIHTELTPSQKQRVLQPLAYQMMRQQRREILWAEAVAIIAPPLYRVNPNMTGEEFLEMIVNSSGLLMEREAGIFSFAHLTFQEYLAAVHIREQKLEPEILRLVDNDWWHETIRLYSAQTDATNIIKACLGQRRPTIASLTLAMECLEEAREVKPRLRNIFERLGQSIEHENPELRRISAEVRLALRVRRMVRVEENKYVDGSFITHAEYQLFLNEERSYGQYHYPDHWRGFEFPPGQGDKVVVGIRPLDATAFCEWLSERDSGEWNYRLPWISERNLVSQTPTETTASYWLVSERGYEFTAFDLPETDLERMTAVLQDRLEADQDLLDTPPVTALFERANALIVGRARQRLFTLLDLDRFLDHDLAQVPDLLQDVNQVRDRFIRARVSGLERALEAVVNRLQSLSVEQARTVNVDDVRDMGQTLLEDLQRVGANRQKQELAQKLVHALNRAQKMAQQQTDLLPQELLRALSQGLQQIQMLRQLVQRAYGNARTRVRVRSLSLLLALLREMAAPHGSSSRTSQYLLHAYVDLYVDFVLLEERLNGRLPAFEGIRIIKERTPWIVP